MNRELIKCTDGPFYRCNTLHFRVVLWLFSKILVAYTVLHITSAVVSHFIGHVFQMSFSERDLWNDHLMLQQQDLTSVAACSRCGSANYRCRPMSIPHLCSDECSQAIRLLVACCGVSLTTRGCSRVVWCFCLTKSFQDYSELRQSRGLLLVVVSILFSMANITLGTCRRLVCTASRLFLLMWSYGITY